MDIDSLKKSIEFAIEKEREAVDFYTQCSKLTTRSGMKKAFLEMADEEKRHVKMLENFKQEKLDSVKIKNTPDLKIGDYLVDMKFDPSMSYNELLILAMKREEASHNLYTNLLQGTEDENIKRLFQMLAQEELKHKNRLEKEYDDFVLKDN